MSNTLESALAHKNLSIAVAAMGGNNPELPRLGTVVPGGYVDVAGRGFAPLKVAAPVIASVPTLVEGPTNFHIGDSAIAIADISATHLAAIAGISHGDFNQGAALEWLGPSIAETLYTGIKNKALALLTTGNYSTAVTTAATNFGTSEVASLAHALRARGRSLFLDTQCFQGIASSLTPAGDGWRYPGFDRAFELTDLSAVGAKVIGCAATPASMAISIAVPKQTPNADVVSQVVRVPGLGVDILTSISFNSATRAFWISAECVIGCAVGTAAALKLVVSP